MYHISKATLKVANKQYCSLKNDYEMTLHTHSSIVPCNDSEGVPAVHCDFVPIAELENRDKDAIIGKRSGSSLEKQQIVHVFLNISVEITHKLHAEAMIEKALDAVV